MTINIWTPAMLTALHDGFHAGHTDEVITADLDVSVVAIRKKRVREGLPRRRAGFKPGHTQSRGPRKKWTRTSATTFNARKVRNDRDITRLVAHMPAQCVLGQSVEVAGKTLVFIGWNPSGEAVCMWERDVVVVSAQ